MNWTNISNIEAEIREELCSAIKKHPDFAKDEVHMAAILAEESGEAVREALNFHYEGGDIDKLKTELRQTGAMVLRFLNHLEELPCRKD